MLKQQIGKLPSKPAEQNALWYSIYRKYETHLTVEQAHQSFLLFRDLTAIALLFAIIGGVALALLGCHFTALAIYIGIMLIHYIGLAWVAQNHGNRLVCNVLVEYALETV